MKYRITIESLPRVEGKDYPTAETVYEQVIDQLDISAVVRMINPEIIDIPNEI